MKPTKKKKNTYVVNKSEFLDETLFKYCKNTPLAVVEINGKQVVPSFGFIACTDFPNPAAFRMMALHNELKDVMGARLSCTIVEYLDKKTNEPVATLYPTNEIMYDNSNGDDFMQRLNHATRQDLKRQMSIREKYLQQLQSKNNQR